MPNPTQNSVLLDTPQGDTDYVIAARCTTDRDCRDEASVSIDVACPTAPEGLGTGSAATPFLGREPVERRLIFFEDRQMISWPSAATVDFVRGDLFGLRATGTFGGTTACLVDNVTDAVAVTDPAQPAPGEAWYYLGRSASHCNLKAGGTYGSDARDTIAACEE